MSESRMGRRRFRRVSLGVPVCLVVLLVAWSTPDRAEAQAGPSLIESIRKETIWRNRDGSAVTWFHPRACVVPGKDGKPVVFMTLQAIGGSDYFGPVHWTESRDLGKTWTDPRPIEALGRDPVAGHDRLKAGVCDVVPQYHPPTGTILALGHVVFYRGPRFARGDQLARYPVYAVRRKDGTWSKRKILRWNDPRGAFIYTNNCGQRVVMPNGDIFAAFSFGPRSEHRMVAGVRCSFDGDELKVAEVGPPLVKNVGRGLLEPSVARFGGKFYMTIRAEDGHGYVAVSDDGIRYDRMTAWAWDDGTPITMSTTQQHWLVHSDGLYLVYTRKDESNTNVIRWRSPLWIARVDTSRLCLVRRTERTALPLVGDGIDAPDKVALMGNFHVTNVSPRESWVTVGEWLPRGGARGDLLLSRIRWAKPNRNFADEFAESTFHLELDDDSPLGAASIREHSIVWHPRRKKFYLVADVVPLASDHHPNTYETDIHLWSSRDLKQWTYHGVAVRRGKGPGSYDRYGVASPAGSVYYDGRIFVPFSARRTSDFGKRSIGLAWSGDDPETVPWTKSPEPISDLEGNDDDPALVTIAGDSRLHLYHRIAGPDGYRIVHSASTTPTDPRSWPKAVPVTPRPETVRAQELTAAYATGGQVHLMVIEHLRAGGIEIAHLASSNPDGPLESADPTRRYVPRHLQPRRLAYSGHITPVMRGDRVIAWSWTVFQDGKRYGLWGRFVSPFRHEQHER